MDDVGVAVSRWQGWRPRWPGWWPGWRRWGWWRWRRPGRTAVRAHRYVSTTGPDLGCLQTTDTIIARRNSYCLRANGWQELSRRGTLWQMTQGNQAAHLLTIPSPANDVSTRRKILWQQQSVDDGRHLNCGAAFRVCTIHLIAPAGLVAAGGGLECRPTRRDLSAAPPAGWDRISAPFAPSRRRALGHAQRVDFDLLTVAPAKPRLRT